MIHLAAESHVDRSITNPMEFINNIKNNKPLPVYGKGVNVRDWLFVEDHAAALILFFIEGEKAKHANLFFEFKS